MRGKVHGLTDAGLVRERFGLPSRNQITRLDLRERWVERRGEIAGTVVAPGGTCTRGCSRASRAGATRKGARWCRGGHVRTCRARRPCWGSLTWRSGHTTRGSTPATVHTRARSTGCLRTGSAGGTQPAASASGCSTAGTRGALVLQANLGPGRGRRGGPTLRANRSRRSRRVIWFRGGSPSRSRRSRRVIWFRGGSPKQGDRIGAWYKLEWELGLSSGFTENYSSRSPSVEHVVVPPGLYHSFLQIFPMKFSKSSFFACLMGRTRSVAPV